LAGDKNVQNRIVQYLAGLACFFAATVRTDGHAFVVRAQPRVGSKVDKAPIEVRIWFSEAVQPVSSNIKVFDERGKQVDKKNTHLDPGNNALLEVSVVSGLPRGIYRVSWRVMSVDTHVTNGDFRFQIAERRTTGFSR
jgi:methionine-rich copper-binding protein CopC